MPRLVFLSFDCVKQKKKKKERSVLTFQIKQTFKAWMNSHLKQCGVRVIDLKHDLQDGLILIALIEILSGVKCKAKVGHGESIRITTY